MAPLFIYLKRKKNTMKAVGIIKSFVVAIILFVASPSFASVPNAVAPTTPVETPDEQIARLTRRIEEIRDMDKSNMSRAERKALKNEVKEIKDQVKATGGGVYLSVGALILVIILLIVLL